MKIVHFERMAISGCHSIERQFREIRLHLPFEVDVVRCPTPAHSKLWFVFGIIKAWRRAGDLNHIVGDTHYLALGLPAVRTIITVHDLNHLDDLRGLRRWLYKLLYFKIPLSRSSVIIAISEHTRNRIVEEFPDFGEKIRIIPDCLPTGFSYLPKVFDTYAPVVLLIGTQPNKNLETVVLALGTIKCRLHIVGKLSETQRTLLDKLGIEFRNSVDLSDQEILDAYVQSDIVSFVSRAEGFGMPILEGQAIGRPVITSNIEPMVTVAGGGAVLVDPGDVAAIRGGFGEIIENEAVRTSLIQRGLKNASRFAARTVAIQYVEAYEDLCDGSRGDLR